MNRLFIALDGDDAGQKIGQAVLMDDVQSLHDISKRISSAGEAVKSMVASMGGQVVSAGGDEMTAMISPEHESRIEEIKKHYEAVSGFSATIGVGNTLSQAGKALIAGKLSGKNMILRYDESTEDILNQAHEHVMDGSGNEEESKLDDHYISHIEDDSSEGYESEDGYEEELPEMSEESFADPSEGLDISPDSSMTEENNEEMMMLPEQEDESESDEYEMDSESQEIPSEENEMAMDSEQEFSEEEPIEIPDGNAIMDENMEQQGPDAEKSDDMVEEAGESDYLEEEMADADGNEEIMQKIAATLAKFKEKKQMMESMRETDPEMYASILEMVKNMIEMAKMIDPDSVGQSQEQQAPEQEAPTQMAVPPMVGADPKLQG